MTVPSNDGVHPPAIVEFILSLEDIHHLGTFEHKDDDASDLSSEPEGEDEETSVQVDSRAVSDAVRAAAIVTVEPAPFDEKQTSKKKNDSAFLSDEEDEDTANNNNKKSSVVESTIMDITTMDILPYSAINNKNNSINSSNKSYDNDDTNQASLAIVSGKRYKKKTNVDELLVMCKSLDMEEKDCEQELAVVPTITSTTKALQMSTEAIKCCISNFIQDEIDAHNALTKMNNIKLVIPKQDVALKQLDAPEKSDVNPSVSRKNEDRMVTHVDYDSDDSDDIIDVTCDTIEPIISAIQLGDKTTTTNTTNSNTILGSTPGRLVEHELANSGCNPCTFVLDDKSSYCSDEQRTSTGGSHHRRAEIGNNNSGAISPCQSKDSSNSNKSSFDMDDGREEFHVEELVDDVIEITEEMEQEANDKDNAVNCSDNCVDMIANSTKNCVILSPFSPAEIPMNRVDSNASRSAKNQASSANKSEDNDRHLNDLRSKAPLVSRCGSIDDDSTKVSNTRSFSVDSSIRSVKHNDDDNNNKKDSIDVPPQIPEASDDVENGDNHGVVVIPDLPIDCSDRQSHCSFDQCCHSDHECPPVTCNLPRFTPYSSTVDVSQPDVEDVEDNDDDDQPTVKACGILREHELDCLGGRNTTTATSGEDSAIVKASSKALVHVSSAVAKGFTHLGDDQPSRVLTKSIDVKSDQQGKLLMSGYFKNSKTDQVNPGKTPIKLRASEKDSPPISASFHLLNMSKTLFNQKDEDAKYQKENTWSGSKDPFIEVSIGGVTSIQSAINTVQSQIKDEKPWTLDNWTSKMIKDTDSWFNGPRKLNSSFNSPTRPTTTLLLSNDTSPISRSASVDNLPSAATTDMQCDMSETALSDSELVTETADHSRGSKGLDPDGTRLFTNYISYVNSTSTSLVSYRPEEEFMFDDSHHDAKTDDAKSDEHSDNNSGEEPEVINVQDEDVTSTEEFKTPPQNRRVATPIKIGPDNSSNGVPDLYRSDGSSSDSSAKKSDMSAASVKKTDDVKIQEDSTDFEAILDVSSIKSGSESSSSNSDIFEGPVSIKDESNDGPTIESNIRTVEKENTTNFVSIPQKSQDIKRHTTSATERSSFVTANDGSQRKSVILIDSIQSVGSGETPLFSNTNKRSPPKKSSWGDAPIPDGDIMLSLLNESPDTTWSARVNEAIWRCRKMRQTLDAAWLEEKVRRVDSEPYLAPKHNAFAMHQAVIDHLRFDELDEALHMSEEVIIHHYEGLNQVMTSHKGQDNVNSAAKMAEYKPLIGNALHELGVVHLIRNEKEKALNYLERAVTNREGCLGAGHPDHIASLVKLAVCQCACEDFFSAQSNLEKALHFHESYTLSAANSKQYAELLNNLGCTSYMCGQIDKSMHFFNRALESQLSVMRNAVYDAPSFSNQLASLSNSIVTGNLGFLALVTRDVAKSLSYLEDTVRNQFLLLREAHGTVMSSMDHLVVANLVAGNDSAALQLLQKMLNMQIEHSGPDSTKCYNISKKIALLQDRNQLKDVVKKQLDSAYSEIQKTGDGIAKSAAAVVPQKSYNRSQTKSKGPKGFTVKKLFKNKRK